jgi:uncharacterized protein (TIGR03067 family)
MRKTLTPLTLALLVVTAVAGDEPKKEAGLDPAKLVGDWTYVSGVRAGEKVEKDRLAGTVTITKDAVTLPAGPDQKFVIGYKIDAKANPATIDLDIKDGPVKEGKAVGIIALDGDEFKLCYVPVEDKDTKRPAKFESTKDNKAFYFVLKRKK